MRLATRLVLLIVLSAGTAPAQTPKVKATVVPPHVLTTVMPVYPPEAKKAGIRGAVVLKAYVSENGNVYEVTAVSGPPELTQAAIDAVSQWHYAPAMLNGFPNEASTTVTVNFNP